MPSILVVDDDADTCRNMADLLGDQGYAVDAADGGGMALEKAGRQPYDLGLLDLWNPVGASLISWPSWSLDIATPRH